MFKLNYGPEMHNLIFKMYYHRGKKKEDGLQISNGHQGANIKYFIDTEFIEDGKTIDLISIGIVREDGLEYYAISREFNSKVAHQNKWLYDNVLHHLPPVMLSDNNPWKMRSEIRSDIINFLMGDNNIEFWGYYSDYDWVAFCQLFGKMIGLPDGWPMYCNDIKQLMRMLDIDKNMPAQLETEGNHHALLGARWNKLAYEHLSEIADFNLHPADSWLRI